MLNDLTNLFPKEVDIRENVRFRANFHLGQIWENTSEIKVFHKLHEAKNQKLSDDIKELEASLNAKKSTLKDH